LHNIVNSVVILDEAQLLPPELLTPCIAALNILIRDYAVTVVLSTATQPALSTLPPPLPRLSKPSEIMPDPPGLYKRLQRTEFCLPDPNDEPVSWPDVAQELLCHDQVLCIVNSRRDCYDLYKLMPPGTVHLSALMCGEHRSEVIKFIKNALKKNSPIRVVSTQLVEAGVDIDFPIVYRALAGVDSLAQAAGRCNREGSLNSTGRLGMVRVFIPPKPAPHGLLRKGEDTTREMLSNGLDMHSPATYDDFFRLFYPKPNDTGMRYAGWLIKDVPQVQFRTASLDFHLIDDAAQRPVFVRYGEGCKWVEQLRHAGPGRDIMRQLQRYTVNLPQWAVKDMLEDGRLACVDSKKAPDMIVQNLIAYDNRHGLDVYSGSYSVENTIY